MIYTTGTNAKTILSNVNEEDKQPNAVDLRVDKVYNISNTLFILDDGRKEHRNKQEIYPNDEGYFVLEPDNHYEIVFANEIKVAEDEAGWVVTRSTLNRNGLFLTSGLYDSGYHGKMAGVLHVMFGWANIKKGKRLGQ